MKKLFTIDDFMIAFVAALGYGLGFEIPKIFGCPEWLSGVICMAAGIALEGIAEKVVFSKFVQKNNTNRIIIFAAFITAFLAAQYFSV